MKIWVNTVVHNEENFIWFALMSIIDHVDKILVWDTGSTDNTVPIIKEIESKYKNKIFLKEVGVVDKYQFTKVRQKMLDQSKCDWVLILDGDEIWWDDSIKKIIREINKKKNIDGIVVPVVVSVGDIFHIQEEKAGQYNLLGRQGHYNLRVINRNIPGLHVDAPYGREGYFDGDNRPVQERKNIIYLDAPYLHVTHLRRSNSKRLYEKFKYELGNRVSDDYKFPEVLYNDYPKRISSPWQKISGFPLLRARIITPIRKLKRRFV